MLEWCFQKTFWIQSFWISKTSYTWSW